jgi:rhomboid protease GluP
MSEFKGYDEAYLYAIGLNERDHAKGIAFQYDRRKFLMPFVILLCLAFWSGCAALGFQRTDMPPIFLWLLTIVLFALCFKLVWRVFRRGSVVEILASGIRVPNTSNDLIPWSSIERFERTGKKRTDNLALYLVPEAAKYLKRRGLASILPARLHANRVTVPLNFLRGDPDWIYKDIADRIRAMQASRLEQFSNREPPEALTQAMYGEGAPIFTYLLIVVLAAIYWGELSLGVDAPTGGAPSLETLFVLGGTLPSNVLQRGQWWRLFSGPLMHGSPLHLLFNCVALWLAGRLLERRIGWRWFAAIFFIGALGGSVASTFLNPGNIVGVGASGGIVGLFAATIVASFHFPPGPVATRLRTGAVQILVPSLLPFLSHPAAGQQIDYAAHSGGAIAGGVLACVLLLIWPKDRFRPRFGWGALTVSVAYVGVAVFSFLPIAFTRHLVLDDPIGRYLAGDYGLAIKGFETRAAEGDENAPYFNLWRFIAQKRSHDPMAESSLALDAAKTDNGKWPHPVLLFFLGQLDEQSMLGRAGDDNQRCEATFYDGEEHLMAGDRLAAIPLLTKAASTCPKTYMEYEGAVGELKRMSAAQ